MSGGCALCALLATMVMAAHANAQAPAHDGCADMPLRPASIDAYFVSVLRPDARPVARPTADLKSFQVAGTIQKASDWAGLCRYRADNRRLAALPKGQRRVVYLGDSITELWGLADPGLFVRNRVNRGISGQTTGQMLLRFEADVVALHPDVVHILAGTNDIAGNEGPRTLDDIQDNFKAMVTLAKANGIQVVLASVPPARSFPWNPSVEPVPQIRALNEWLRSYAAAVGATYVDYYALLAGPDGGMDPTLTFDGVHLNGAGYDRIRGLSEGVTKDQ